ncbi:baseplate J/gp47 family protein [Methylobacter tundripaludum]|uniref:baseplate J/gp47 family protein n=1 Tax=Methylobacter tundripaludum TaxID=173365 RepID=UPI0004DEFB8E|nr:baseplate J/gp47 family protein [Methylobacter tundripaludum]
MAFSRPTLSDLIVRAFADIQSRLPGTDATLRRSNLNVLSRVHSAAVHGLYGFISWLATQIIYDTAEAEYLERWAGIWKVYRIPASFATGSVTLTGTNGVTIPALTELQRADGVLYTVDADVVIAAGTAVVAVTAVETGQVGNAVAGYALMLTTPIGGVTATATAGVLSGGSDAELDDSLRARFIARIQQSPHGGAKHDYEAWALEVAGVTRAWVYPQELGPGSVTVRFVRDNDASPIPDAGEVVTVQSYIDNLRPVTASVTVAAPIAAPLNYSIAVVPNTAAVKAAVTAELADLISRESIPGGTLLLSHQRAAISAAAGETNYTMTAPVADVMNATGYMTTLGVITWL